MQDKFPICWLWKIRKTTER